MIFPILKAQKTSRVICASVRNRPYEVKAMVSVARLQAYLRHSAQRQYDAVPVPPFTLFFHPTDSLPYFNYAIPDQPSSGDLEASLSMLQDEFATRGRHPRFEFIQEFAPQLSSALDAAGFAEEARQQFMICTAETYRGAAEVSGLAIAELTSASTVGEVQDYLTTQRRGFDARGTEGATEGDAERFLRTIGGGRAFVGWLEGQPVGAGMFTSPFDGVTEIVGLATLESYRRRGIATGLTAQAVERALEQEVQVVCLTAADEQAGRVYERVGFARYATMLAYALEPR
jgi:ribosomal protein S18 acetylase RimI-like enzyme